MTREEAIETVRRAFDAWESEYDVGDDWSKKHEARDMAIKALEKEPCEDAVSKEDVLSEIIRFSTEEGSSVECQQLYCDVNNMPSVTPQPKTGHWIFVEGIKGKDNVEKCSCCGSHWREAIIYRTDTQEYLRTRLLYCPNCGAKMVEPQESEDKG